MKINKKTVIYVYLLLQSLTLLSMEEKPKKKNTKAII